MSRKKTGEMLLLFGSLLNSVFTQLCFNLLATFFYLDTLILKYLEHSHL